MMLALICTAVVAAVELLLWTAPLWRWRRYLAVGLMAAVLLTSLWLFWLFLNVAGVLFLLFTGYRLLNLLRVFRNRFHADNLYQVTRRTCLALLGLQLLTVISAVAQDNGWLSSYMLLYGLLAVQLGGALIVWLVSRRNLRGVQPPVVSEAFADHDLPTLTVAIPARNETEDLQACLASLLHSDYPKLEILVLDDCSQDRRTPEIIRDFAHDGVRFVQGQLPPDRWLAKNYAYQQLLEAANGEVVLFCGVDCRFSDGSLRQLVTQMLHRRKRMLSVIPINQLPPKQWGRTESLLIQPGRYAWELAVPRRWLHRTPVLSTCWLIDSDLLRSQGGFEAVAHSISPESYFARHCAAREDAYGFVASDAQFGLYCQKSLIEQRATAIRTRYPQLHKRLEMTAITSLAELVLLLMPFVVLLTALAYQRWLIAAVSLLSAGLQTYSFARIVQLTYRSRLRLSWLLLIPAAVYDIVLLNTSMWQYEFGEVIWKDRNICIPMMQTIRALPPLPEPRD